MRKDFRMGKICLREQLKRELDIVRAEGGRWAFTNGCFDILHVGHVRYLREARGKADALVVAVNSDSSVRAIKGDKKPLVPEAERAEILAALKVVDYVIIFSEETPLSLIEDLRPDVLIKGGDWEEDQVVGRDAVRSWGGKVIIVPFTEGFSTTNIVDKILRVYRE